MWRAYVTTTVVEVATQTLAGSVGTYVTVLQGQSNRFRYATLVGFPGCVAYRKELLSCERGSV